MKLKHYFILLALCLTALAGIALYATFGSHPVLFYVTEGMVVAVSFYLVHFYHKTLRPFDTIINGMELLREQDMTTFLASQGQHETDEIVKTFNTLLKRLRNEHLQLSEQNTFLNLLIEASPMGVVQCDLDGNVTSMNPAAREMMTPAVSEVMKMLPLGEETTVRLTGAPQIYRVSHLSFPDRGYQHPFFLVESLTSEVRRAEKGAYERVIRMIAHEVNNSVAGIISLMENGKLKMEDVDGASERLAALSEFVTRFADVVKIPQPQLQLCDLSEEVEACRPFLENICLSAHISIEFHLTEEASPVHLDSILFQQVLINIVKNAAESIGEAKGLITVTTTPHQLIVTDNGRGIPPAVASHLFTPFFSTKPQGQGLGLLLIRDILTAHQCTFSLLTDPDDHLTRFTIHFPT